MRRACAVLVAVAMTAACAGAACSRSDAQSAAPGGSGSHAGGSASGSRGGGGGRGGRGGFGGLAFPVQVATVDLRNVEYQVEAPGTLAAFEQVQVTARVSGAIDRVAFTEGQEVKKGDILVVIESERYAIAVEQAKAQIDKATAQNKAAQAALARRQGAQQQNPGLIPGEEITTYETTVETTKADMEAAKQALATAYLNLRDAYVRAPIAGVIQTRTVQTGQYVQTGAVLATLLQRDPLLVRFQVTEQDAPRLKPGTKTTISLRESQHTYQATITLVSGSADPVSHLVPVTAEVDDKEHKYWLRPGAFCDVTIPVGSTRQAVVVPELAIRASERGFIAYVVKDNVAHERVLTLGMHTGEGNVEVTKGLDAGDALVVRGGEPLSDGAGVRVVEQTTIEQFDASAPIPSGGPPAASASAAASAAPAPAASGSGGGRRRQVP